MLAALLLNLGQAPAPPAPPAVTHFGGGPFYRRYVKEEDEVIEPVVEEVAPVIAKPRPKPTVIAQPYIRPIPKPVDDDDELMILLLLGD